MKEKKPTAEQIEAEIKALEVCKEYVPKSNLFGENNHRKLDLQIEYLKEGIDTSSDEYFEMEDWERMAIYEAESWKEGDETISPSQGWDSFKPEAKDAKPKGKKAH